MQKRRNQLKINLQTSINGEDTLIMQSLNISQYESQINTYNLIKDTTSKVEWLINSIISESKKLDLFSEKVLFYDSSTNYENNTNDLVKFCLCKLKEFSDEVDNNDNETDLYLPKELFFSLVTEAYTSNDLRIRNIALDILINFSSVSSSLTKYFVEEEGKKKPFGILFSMTFLQSPQIISNCFLLIGNIFCDCKNEIEDIIQIYPIHHRIREILQSNIDIDPKEIINFHLSCLSILNQITFAITSFDDFVDFIPLIQKYFINNCFSNESLYNEVLSLLAAITRSDQVCDKIMECGMSWHFLHLLNQKKTLTQNDYLNLLLQIFSNLLYQKYIVDFYINAKCFPSFEKILNTFINSANPKDNSIIQSCIFALGNIAGGTAEQINKIFCTNLPKLILQVCKIKNTNAIYFETCSFFFNSISNGDNQEVISIIKMKGMKLFCEGLNKSINSDNVILCLKGILRLLKRNMEIYNTIQNLKNEYYGYCGKKNIDVLMDNKNETISMLATQLNDLIEKNEIANENCIVDNNNIN